MEDQNRIQFPSIASQDPPKPLGVFDDMQADGLVDDALLAGQRHPPVIFGAGGPMCVRVLAKTESTCLTQHTQAEAVR